MQVVVLLQVKLIVHFEVLELNTAKGKHDKHFSGLFSSQVAQLALHFKVHFALLADKT